MAIRLVSGYIRSRRTPARMSGCNGIASMADILEKDYWFVVVDADSNRSVEIDIRPYDESAKTQFQSVWQRLFSALREHYKLCRRPLDEWMSWRPWDWCEERKPGYEARMKYAAWAGDIAVGFINVWRDFPSAHNAGQNVLYLEHIAAAPGNIVTEIWNRKFRSVGSALLAYSVLLSHQFGFEGRIGLHASDDDALNFYRCVNRKCNNTLLQPEVTGIEGPTPRRAFDAEKTYLETTELGATLWLEGYRRE